MKKQLLDTLYRARDYTLAVAEAMPEKDYTFKPEGAGWNFAELLNHIGYGIQWYQSNYLLGKEREWQPLAVNGEKKDVLDYLARAFQDLENGIPCYVGPCDSPSWTSYRLPEVSWYNTARIYLLIKHPI